MIVTTVSKAAQVKTRCLCQTSQRSVTCKYLMAKSAGPSSLPHKLGDQSQAAQYSPTSGDTSPVACRLTCNKILQKCAFTDRKLRRKSVQGMRLDALAQYLMTHDDLLLPSQKAFVPRLLNTSSLARYSTHMTFSVCVQQPGASTNSSPVSPKQPPPPLGTPTTRQGSSR